jgi:eukaryotic-like serine/threonine-protein kinase
MFDVRNLPRGWTEPTHNATILEKTSCTKQTVLYKAKQNESGRQLALKISLAVEVDDIGRFKREAELLKQMSHPNVARYAGFGLIGAYPFILIEWLEGETLADVLLRKKMLTPQEVMPVLADVCSALQYAHSLDLIHRDIKPSNIFMERSQNGLTIRLIDFGMAKPTNSNLELTPAGLVLGSPAYMSPEQCTGQTLDLRSDVYSLSCVLYECLSGNTVFSGESNMDAMYKHLHDAPKPLEPSEFSRVILRGLEKSPADRFQSAKALSRAWSATLQRLSAMQWIKKYWLIIIVVIAIVAGLFVGLLLL